MNTDSTNPVPAVYGIINAVQSDLSKEGISKDRRNQQQGYNFRGIDDVYNALSPLLAKHGLVILPRVLSRTSTERETQKGGVLFYVTIEAEFDFVAASDASKHTVKTFGEAMDSADKATNKAMSAAYKYAAFQAFAIPTEADNDADSTTHEVAPRAEEPKPSRRQYRLEGAETKESAAGQWRGTVQDVQERSGVGKNTGKPWKCYDVIFTDGRTASTFDKELAESIPTNRLIEATVVPGKYKGSLDFKEFAYLEEEPAA